jgi:hypothetical protein
MSREALTQVVERASRDPAFRSQLQSSPDSALAGYDLTAEERAAVLSSDPGEVRSLGVDPRISKQANPNIPGDEGPLS